MSINNPSFLLDATLAATGGTAKAFVANGENVANGIGLIESGYASYLTARRITLKNKPSYYDRTKGLWVPLKRESTVALPVLRADGTYGFESYTLVYNGLPETAVAVNDTNRNLAAQVLFDTDLTSFWREGALV